MRECLQRLIPFLKHTQIQSHHILYSPGLQLVFLSSQLCVIHDECVTFTLGENGVFVGLTFGPPESGVSVSDTLIRLPWIAFKWLNCPNAQESDSCCAIRELSATTKEVSLWNKFPISFTRTCVTKIRKPHIVCISLPSLYFVCKQDINSLVIVFVHHDCELSHVCVMVWYSSACPVDPAR